MNQKSSPHVLGIVGSPRRNNGNTALLVAEVLRGAVDAGAAVETVWLSTLKIAPCRACDACLQTGQCAQRDDMEALWVKVAASPIWVLGTPVYWWGPTAQFKAFLDRWYAKVHRAEEAMLFRGRRVILVVPMGDSDVATARHTVGMMQDALDYVRAELVATVLAPGVNDRGEVNDHPELLAAAYQAGRQAVESLTAVE